MRSKATFPNKLYAMAYDWCTTDHDGDLKAQFGSGKKKNKYKLSTSANEVITHDKSAYRVAFPQYYYQCATDVLKHAKRGQVVL